MKRKRKYSRPPARIPNNAGPPGAAVSVPTTLVAIDLNAGKGRNDIVAGSRVTILGSGLYAGETAVVERLAGGVIPTAFVRTEAGRTRQVRTIDLQPVSRATEAKPGA
jgi:hypothetical protein